MDEEVPPARTRGGGRAGAALQARATWAWPGDTGRAPGFLHCRGAYFLRKSWRGYSSGW